MFLMSFKNCVWYRVYYAINHTRYNVNNFVNESIKICNRK